jgi:hypothetical protein
MRLFRIELCHDTHIVAQISNGDLKVSAARQRSALLKSRLDHVRLV